jgi:glycoside/pentoside/hexuronide:cation symporter, GPH family
MVRQMFSNGSFMILVIGFLMLSMGTTWASSLFMLFATFVVDVEASTQILLLGFYLTQLVSLPAWVWISFHIGKKETWVVGAVIYVLATPGYMMLGAGDVIWFCIVLGLYGIASGNFVAISLSMKADLIEIAGYRTGSHVAGSYMAVWSLGQKFFQALAVGMALPIVSYFGFDPKGSNGPDELLALTLTLTIPPMMLYATSVFVIWRFPLSSARLSRLRQKFQRRELRRSR